MGPAVKTCVLRSGFAWKAERQTGHEVLSGQSKLPENLEPPEVKPAQLEWEAGSMHENCLDQWWSKRAEVQHAPHACHHSEFALCFLCMAFAVRLLIY